MLSATVWRPRLLWRWPSVHLQKHSFIMNHVQKIASVLLLLRRERTRTPVASLLWCTNTNHNDKSMPRVVYIYIWKYEYSTAPELHCMLILRFFIHSGWRHNTNAFVNGFTWLFCMDERDEGAGVCNTVAYNAVDINQPAVYIHRHW